MTRGLIAGIVLVAIGGAAGSASSQEAPAAETRSPAVPDRSCPGQAAAYATEKGLRVWVTRAGTLSHQNPLRPLSPEILTVLQVAVNGRLASAYGTDPQFLREGGAPARLESENGARITWNGNLAGLPEELRIVAEDGTVLVGPLRFTECGEAPKVAAARTPPTPRAPGTRKPVETSREPTAVPRGLSLPQGALPQGALPQGALPGGSIR